MKNCYFAYRSFWPELATMKKFRKAGIKTICFLSGNTCNSLGEPYCKYPPTWVWSNTYEFEPLDHQIEDILSAVPDAELLCMIDLNTPYWYIRQHAHDHKIDALDSFDMLGCIVNSEEWRKDTADYLEAFLKHCEEKYADRIKAYILTGGATCEWIDRSDGCESNSRLAGYQKYCRENHLLPIPDCIPPKNVRDHVSAGDLRDPVKDAEALRYWKFNSCAVRETVEFFLKRARKTLTRNVELGVFYGYILEICARNAPLCASHLDYEALFRLKELDFVISPGNYFDRSLGGGVGSQTPVLTIQTNGKRYLYECDQRTHTYNRQISKYVPFNDAGHFPDEAGTIAGMKREFAYSLVHQASMWFFDMWGGFYKGKNIYSLLGQMSSLWEKWAFRKKREGAEILFVVDPESMYYTTTLNEDPYEYCVLILRKLNRLGTPYNICSFGDLKKLDRSGALKKFKLVIMGNLFVLDDARLDIVRKTLMKDNRTILWQYLPGVIMNGKFDRKNIRILTGISSQIKGPETKIMDGWTSVYAPETAQVTASFIRKTGKAAGVHFYAPENIIVYGDADLLAVHCGPETKNVELALPGSEDRLLDLFSGKEYSGKKIRLSPNGAFTWLFQKIKKES